MKSHQFEETPKTPLRDLAEEIRKEVEWLKKQKEGLGTHTETAEARLMLNGRIISVLSFCNKIEDIADVYEPIKRHNEITSI